MLENICLLQKGWEQYYSICLITTETYRCFSHGTAARMGRTKSKDKVGGLLLSQSAWFPILCPAFSSCHSNPNKNTIRKTYILSLRALGVISQPGFLKNWVLGPYRVREHPPEMSMIHLLGEGLNIQ